MSILTNFFFDYHQCSSAQNSQAFSEERLRFWRHQRSIHLHRVWWSQWNKTLADLVHARRRIWWIQSHHTTWSTHHFAELVYFEAVGHLACRQQTRISKKREILAIRTGIILFDREKTWRLGSVRASKQSPKWPAHDPDVNRGMETSKEWNLETTQGSRGHLPDGDHLPAYTVGFSPGPGCSKRAG